MAQLDASKVLIPKAEEPLRANGTKDAFLTTPCFASWKSTVTEGSPRRT